MAKRKPAGAKPADQKTPAKKPARSKPASAAEKKAPGGKKTVKAPKSRERPKKTAGSAPASEPRPKSERASADGPGLHALLIGCDCYLPNQLDEGSYPSLRGCVRDAEQVEQFLRDRAGLTDDRLIKLTSSDNGKGQPKEPKERWPTYENIIGGFQTVTTQARKGDHVYVHYSGHGGRCPTIVPKLKSPDGLDESLVPIDIGNDAARYVRDVEIAKLLKEMSDKELVVTVVVDSCHSGGITRAAVRGEDGVRVRGVEFIDRKKRPTTSLVGTADELAAVVASAETRGADGTRGMAAAAEVSGGVVLAACRPSELAREYSVDGSNTQGALTYWYLSIVGHGPEDLTFRTVYDIVQARIHGKFSEQTPMLFGNPDRKLFGGLSVPAAPTVPISAVSANGQTLTLASGQAALIQIGMDFAVYPPDVDPADTAARVALAHVTAASITTATAQVTKSFGDRKVQIGDRATAVGVAQKLVRKIRLTPCAGAPATTAKSLQQVEQAVKGRQWVELVAGADDTADFIVTTTQDGKHYDICDAGGVSLEVGEPLATVDTKSAKAVVDRLVHLARFQAVRGLDNSDPFSPLRGKLVAELYATPSNYQEGGPLTNLKRLPSGRVPTVKKGKWIVLSVTNRSSDVVNVVVLDLASDWEVSIANRNESFHPIDPGATWQLLLQAGLPEGRETGKDMLKVIATLDPPPPYELLTLPSLDNPIPNERERGVTRSGGPLEALLAAATADQPTRSLSTSSQTTRGWAVTHTEVDIIP